MSAISPWDDYPRTSFAFFMLLILWSIQLAFDIRTFALRDFGYVIHEFDPWFNYRATQYLEQHGVKEFFTWFDHRSWFPLGRPVGTTIYPGMQLTAVFIYDLFRDFGANVPQVGFLKDLSSYTLNEVCCLMPCWFGVAASLATGLLAYECTGKYVVGSVATFIMAIIPAHIMRSVGGGFDNESVAVTAMVLTFYLWVRSIRETNSVLVSFLVGVLCGISYIYMVAAWGGYIFVLNMIAFHAAYLSVFSNSYTLFSSRELFSYKLSVAYSCFYIFGTAGAVQIPVVGWAPLKSLEQLFGLVALVVVLSIAVCQFYRDHVILPRLKLSKVKSKGKDSEVLDDAYKKFIVLYVSAVICLAAVVVALLYPTGYFGPLSSRIRGLFVPHTRTGNPLVDSVAEHRAASPSAYIRYLHVSLLLFPIGIAVLLTTSEQRKRRTQNSFLICYAGWSYYFSSKMVRLMILLGPIASCLSGVALDFLISWSYRQIFMEEREIDPSSKIETESKSSKEKPKQKAKRREEVVDADQIMVEIYQIYESNKFARKVVAGIIIGGTILAAPNFFRFCFEMAHRSSHPSIMFMATNKLGQEFIVDDYREAYWYLRDNTPEDSRVLAWWDYGYQISGIGERITIADGNTWNHEHIATLGKCLVSEERAGHEMIRHLADYVLVWTGGGGDDLAKSPHIARISNSVYTDICGLEDPLCRQFGFSDRNRNEPTKMMKDSVIYKLYSGEADPDLWELIYTSKHAKVKIYKVKQVDMESRNYSFDSSNYLCDESGWLCRGQYPPKFRKFMLGKKDFSQLEDFNVEKSKTADEYQKKYHEAFTKGGG